jgi:hypothetical protein
MTSRLDVVDSLQRRGKGVRGMGGMGDKYVNEETSRAVRVCRTVG